MGILEDYYSASINRIKQYPTNTALLQSRDNFFNAVGISAGDCIYNYHWLGTPILQLPTDLIAFQDLLYRTKTNKIIETGIAFGGSVLFNAAILHLLEFQGLIKDPHIFAIDIEIRSHNLDVLQQSPFRKYYTLTQASSVDPSYAEELSSHLSPDDRTMIFLDSNHTSSHVLNELELYSGYCSVGNYIVVGDTAIENAPESMVSARDWSTGNSPMTAIYAFLELCSNRRITDRFTGHPCNFVIDPIPEHLSLLTSCPSGFLRRVS